MSNKLFDLAKAMKAEMFDRYIVEQIQVAIQPYYATNGWLILVYGCVRKNGWFVMSRFNDEHEPTILFFDVKETYLTHMACMLDIK